MFPTPVKNTNVDFCVLAVCSKLFFANITVIMISESTDTVSKEMILCIQLYQLLSEK